jgi:hypothetical protein
VNADAGTGFRFEKRFQGLGERKGMINFKPATAQPEHQINHLIGNFEAGFGFIRFAPEQTIHRRLNIHAEESYR